MVTGNDWLACLTAVITLSTGARAADYVGAKALSSGEQKHLAVIVPAYRGDLLRAVSSLERWPTVCSPLTQANVDLVLYYAEGDEDAKEVDEASEKISETAGRCFAKTKTVFAKLEEHDDFYPKGPSVQFYKMFLDNEVRTQLAEYDALAIIEWDVLVAADNSFEELYKAAFVEGSDFWVKGSNLGGTNFHTTAQDHEMWHVLGHINGNAIYNNNDPAFVEYVEYTRARWQYEHPYDVALWLTISDFPYSWPLWQRYSSKFVTTSLIASVGGEHVDSSSVTDAVAGHTLFIHGNRVDEGNIASRKAVMKETNKRRPYSATDRKRKRDRKRRRHLQAPLPEEAIDPACTSACGSEKAASSLPEGTSTVCDSSCGNGNPLIDDFLCDAGDADKYGSKCRICFTDEEEARRLQHVLLDSSDLSMQPNVIMCDTMKPPEPECSSECLSSSYTICDDSCGTGRYGDFDCNWKDGGHKCRFCFNDVEAALAVDKIAKLEGGRVIMCSTMEPPLEPNGNDVGKLALPFGTPELPGDGVDHFSTLDASEVQKVGDETATNPNISRRLQKWRENEKWKLVEKWKLTEKYKQLEKWRFDGIRFPEPPGQEVCLDECPRLYSNEVTGRICDENCATRVFGFVGCRAKDNLFGTNCRLCYVNEEDALEVDDIENNERAIMCDTGLPVDVYRRRIAEDPNNALSIGRSLQDATRRPNEASTSVVANDLEGGSYRNTEVATTEIDNLFSELSRQPFTEDITRGEICAFIAGREEDVDKWEVTVRSILQFEPGMHVAIAVEGDPQVYHKAFGNFPGVIVRRTPNAFLAGLNADKHCGPGTRLIYYVEADSVLSRTFTAKDTHSPDGELLVVYSEPRTRDAVELSILSNSVLGFRPPSFTQGADLILPVEANAALRGLVMSKLDREEATPEEAAALLESMGEFLEIAAVPQILAAHEYSKKASGIWFFNPQAWVAEHLFKPASIWEIPLVKPRFACTLPVNARLPNTAEVLEESLEFFSHGGKCENGLIAVDASR